MEGSQNDIPNSQSSPTNVREEAHFEDEINLIDYVRVLWKRKYFILLGSVLPALVVGLITFSRPRDYKMTYLYDVGLYGKGDGRGVGLGEKDYKMLLDRFYSAENLDKVTSKLRENGLDEYARKVAGATTDEALKGLVDFEVSPSYFETLNASKTADVKKLQEIQQFRGTLLAMTIRGEPEEDMQKISLIIRDDFEKVIPVYFVEEQLNAATRDYRAEMASIEENRFNLELALRANKSILAKLKSIKTGISDKTEGRVTLQFDVGGRSEYLPLGYQIRAAEAKIIELEENIKVNTGKYNYYKNLLALNEKLSAELKNSISSYYTIQQFHSFLTKLIGNYKAAELKDYLASYIKRIENRISASAPVSEKPKICPVPKGTINKPVMVFVVLLIITTFVAFLLEGLKKSQAQAS